MLPQVAPDFSEFIAELLDCGVTGIDFRAEAHECRLMVMVDEVSRVPAFVKTGTSLRRVGQYAAILVFMLLCTVAINFGFARTGSDL